MPANTIDDQRSSLMTILSKVKKRDGGGPALPMKAEERQSIASFLLQNNVGDSFQPNLQMFESLASLLSQGAVTPSQSNPDVFSPMTSQLQQDRVERTSNNGMTNILTNFRGAPTAEENEFSFQRICLNNNGSEKKGLTTETTRAASIGRQNAKARLAALKQSK